MPLSSPWRRLLLAALLAAATPWIAGEESPPGDGSSSDVSAAAEDLDVVRRSHDDALLAAAQERLLEGATLSSTTFAQAVRVAESYLYRADELRDARKVGGIDDETAATSRERQAEWSRAAVPWAERALELAGGDSERARAERVLGELWVHQISGPIAGLLNGPKALEHIRNALELAPTDAECQRAIGLMYLNNPPINGGDVDAAIRTFRGCARARPDDDRFQLLLALAFRKKGKTPRAVLAARKAVHLNPRNVHARRLLELLEAPEPTGEVQEVTP